MSSTASATSNPASTTTSSNAWVWARRAAVVNLIAQMGIVVTGGLVRLTGSGLGCPTWPRCTVDSLTPTATQVEGFHKYIEFGNRTLTGILLIAAIAVAVAVWRIPRRPGGLLLLAVMPLALTVAQAVLGGITVLLKLSPTIVAAHMLLSMVAIALSTVLWLRLREHDEPALRASSPRARSIAIALGVDAALVLALGTVVTGSGPHSGDSASSRLPFDITMVARLHALSVWAFVALLAALWWHVRSDADPRLRRSMAVLVGIVVVQGVVGYAQYAMGVPWGLVAVHLALAALFAAAVTAVVHQVRAQQLITLPRVA